LEPKAGGLRIQSQPGLHNKAYLKKKQFKKRRKEETKRQEGRKEGRKEEEMEGQGKQGRREGRRKRKELMWTGTWNLGGGGQV
jgi:hypothetical protein